MQRTQCYHDHHKCLDHGSRETHAQQQRCLIQIEHVNLGRFLFTVYVKVEVRVLERCLIKIISLYHNFYMVVFLHNVVFGLFMKYWHSFAAVIPTIG